MSASPEDMEPRRSRSAQVNPTRKDPQARRDPQAHRDWQARKARMGRPAWPGR